MIDNESVLHFCLRWWRSLTICHLGFHCYGFDRHATPYEDIPHDGFVHKVCHACYKGELKTTDRKATKEGRFVLYG